MTPNDKVVINLATASRTASVCPICFNSKKLEESDPARNARLAGATPLWDWIGEGATVFSY